MSGAIQTVRDFTRGWRHTPHIDVVASPRDFPVAAPADARGLHLAGRVYVVDGNPDDVQSILGHELVAHAGLRAVLSPEGWGDFMAAIAAGARGGDPALAGCLRHVRAVYRDARGERYLTGRQEADELGARLAELVFDPEMSALYRPRAAGLRRLAVRRRLARELLLLDIPATGDETRGALLEAEGWMRDGAPLWARLFRCYSPATMPAAKPMGPTRPATSLRESEAMLRAEAGREREKSEWRFLWDGMVLFGSGLFALFAVGYVIALIFGIVRL